MSTLNLHLLPRLFVFIVGERGGNCRTAVLVFYLAFKSEKGVYSCTQPRQGKGYTKKISVLKTPFSVLKPQNNEVEIKAQEPTHRKALCGLIHEFVSKALLFHPVYIHNYI